jgi:hypothetical protein
MRFAQSFSFLLSLLLLLPSYAISQERLEEAEQREINNRVQNCETGLVYQEDIIRAAVEQIERGGVLIVVARLGDGENSRELNRRRLYNEREYLRERGGLAADKVVVAEGARVRGYGRLEYYLGGRLFEQLLFRRNGYICHSCCGPDERYYPYKEVYDRQQRQRLRRRG